MLLACIECETKTSMGKPGMQNLGIFHSIAIVERVVMWAPITAMHHCAAKQSVSMHLEATVHRLVWSVSMPTLCMMND